MATRIMLFSGERREGASEGQYRGMERYRERVRGEGGVSYKDFREKLNDTCIYGNH
jgi:hypothetical protein